MVLAGGTTTYEAAFAGLPSVNILEKPDYGFLIQELVDYRVCVRAGETFSSSLAVLSSVVVNLIQNRHELFAMHQRSRG